MTTIKSAHDLLDIPDAASEAPASAMSRYCYLFLDMANEGSPESPVRRPSGCYSDIPENANPRPAEDKSAERLRMFINHFHSAGPVEGQMMRLPAAYTYIGQFISHDVSAPIGGLLRNVDDDPPGIIGPADPDGVGKNFRGDTRTILERFMNQHAKPLTLSSLYGDGPECGIPEVDNLYKINGKGDGKTFPLATTYDATLDAIDKEKFANAKQDIRKINYRRGAKDIRREGRVPVIADQRNDSNLILSQLHLAFLLFHNKAVEAVDHNSRTSAECFKKARRLVTQHYHWLIRHDYLPKLMSAQVLKDRPLETWKSPLKHPHEVPMEFTTAAFRFGHSMVGSAYDYNENFGVNGVIKPFASFGDLLEFTSQLNMGRPTDDTLPLPHHWVIDWDRMTRPVEAGKAPSIGQAEQIDVNVIEKMLDFAKLANFGSIHASIAFRNMMRGFHRRIPFGHRLAEGYNVPVLDDGRVLDAISTKANRAEVEALGIHKETPAWLYLLLEAQFLEQGQRLGPTASHIIGDTLLHLIYHDDNCVLKDNGRDWDPKDSPLKGDHPDGLRTIRDFLMFAVKDTDTPPS